MRARVDKATPGPWDVGIRRRRDNAEFIAAARTDIPALLDALDAAEALVSTLGSALGDIAGLNEDMYEHVEIDATARAALASYQEWDRANPSTGEGTE